MNSLGFHSICVLIYGKIHHHINENQTLSLYHGVGVNISHGKATIDLPSRA